MTERKNNKRLGISVRDIENENLKKKLKKYYFLLKKFQIKKLMIFKNQSKILRMMKTMNLNTY